MSPNEISKCVSLYAFVFRIISLNSIHKTFIRLLDGGSSCNFFFHSVSLPLSALLKQITAPVGDGEVAINLE